MTKETINYKTYFLYDKRKSLDEYGITLYIGYTKLTLEKRLKAHLSNAKYSKTRTHKINWINSIGLENVGIILKEDNIASIEKALEKEVLLIKQGKRCALCSGYNIVNGDNGGFGNTKDYQEEVLSKIRIALLGNNNPTRGIENTKKVNQFKKDNPGTVLTRDQIIRLLNKKVRVCPTRKYQEETILKIFSLWNISYYTTLLISTELNIPRNSIQSILHDSKYYQDIKEKYKLVAHKRGNLGGINDPDKIKKRVEECKLAFKTRVPSEKCEHPEPKW